MKFDPVECLKDLVRIDTTNPPGNEQEALRYIKTLLDREQIESSIQETAEGRGNLVACIPSARAVKGSNLILLSHIDVVGADPSEWTCPPFEAREMDGYIHGRGTVDTKQLTAMELAAFLNLKTLQKDQNRDVYLVVTCDEESGSEYGLKALLQGEVILKGERIAGRELFKHSEVISEGGGFPVLVGGSRFYLCESGQKGAATVKFHVKAKEGNGPFFTSGDGVVRAMELVKHIGGMELESRRLETVRLFLERLMKAAGVKSEEDLSRSLSPFMNKILKAMQQNTMTVTVIEGKNVNETVVTADVRLLPGYGRDYLERVAGELAGMYDASCEVESFSEGYESVVEGSLPAALSECTKAEFSDGRTEFLPFISMGSSDGRFLVPLSARVYGYSPVYDWDMTFDSAVLMVHGRNERIHRDSVGLGSRILTAAVTDCVTLAGDIRKDGKAMINRNEVAREKLDQAVKLMAENGVDMWVVYSRKKQDPSLELLFNAGLQNEILFVIAKDGQHVALADESDVAALKDSGLYARVTAVTADTIMGEFKKIYDAADVKKLALNMTAEDDRCDGLSKGLYKKLCGCIGEETMERIQTSSFGMLEYLRAVKTPSEVEIMQECSRITTDIYDEVFSKIHVGMSEADVGQLMLDELAKRGCVNGIGEPDEYPMVLLVRCGMSHRKSSPKNVIKPGDMLVIDFSCRYNGYTSDIARTMYFLKPGEEHAPAAVKHCVDSAIKAVGEVLKVIKPGMKGYEVDAVGRQSILDSGYPNIPHSVGHQVGLECHDGGTVLGPNKSKKAMCGVLRKNEIYALEPTVLQDGGLPCAIVEDNVILTDDGCRLISKRQTQIVEIPYREG